MKKLTSLVIILTFLFSSNIQAFENSHIIIRSEAKPSICKRAFSSIARFSLKGGKHLLNTSLVLIQANYYPAYFLITIPAALILEIRNKKQSRNFNLANFIERLLDINAIPLAVFIVGLFILSVVENHEDDFSEETQNDYGPIGPDDNAVFINVYEDTEGQKTVAKRQYNKLYPNKEAFYTEASSWKSFFDKLIFISKHRGPISHLEFAGHGNIGKIFIHKQRYPLSQVLNNYKDKLKGVFRPNAKFRLRSCKTARGEIGEAFLIDFKKSLQVPNGLVIASTLSLKGFALDKSAPLSNVLSENFIIKWSRHRNIIKRIAVELFDDPKAFLNLLGLEVKNKSH